jgi:hypothetical protein
MAGPFPTPSGPERDAAFAPRGDAEAHPQPPHEPDVGRPDTGRQPDPPGGSAAARGFSLVLAAVGGLLIFPLGAVVHTPNLEAFGVILAVVGIGGTLASRPGAARNRPQPPTRR